MVDEIFRDIDINASEEIHKFYESVEINVHVVIDLFPRNLANLILKLAHRGLFILRDMERTAVGLIDFPSSSMRIGNVEVSWKRKERDGLRIVIERCENDSIRQITPFMGSSANTGKKDVDFSLLFARYLLKKIAPAK